MSQSILKIANLELPETSVDAPARTAFIDPSQETSRLALRRVHASQFIFVPIRININPALSKIEHLARDPASGALFAGPPRAGRFPRLASAQGGRQAILHGSFRSGGRCRPRSLARRP